MKPCPPEREKNPSQDRKNEEGNHCRNQKINPLNTKENDEGNHDRNQEKSFS
jgi:hypothetical protein